MNKVMGLGNLLIVVLYWIIGMFGYMTWVGTNQESIIKD